MTTPPAPDGAVRHELPPELLHELRTPLTQIIGYSEMLMEQAAEAGHEDYLPDLRKVNAAGYRLLALMEENFHSVRPAAAPPGAAAPHPAPPPPARRPDAAG
ncbi:MAG TPA: histidine kinase dimerization/phospho-acceptor domain-containing protein [Longimicrobium sp.]|nr:histidine kinase dimerization/phospho-acceptor domain-containing protein [Longimicrobium sp.]